MPQKTIYSTQTIISVHLLHQPECFWCIFTKFCVKFNDCSLFNVSVSTSTKKLFWENCHNFSIYQPIVRGMPQFSNAGLNTQMALLVTQIWFESQNLFVTLCIGDDGDSGVQRIRWPFADLVIIWIRGVYKTFKLLLLWFCGTFWVWKYQSWFNNFIF